MTNVYREGKSSNTIESLNELTKDTDFLRGIDVSGELDMTDTISTLPEQLRQEVRALIDRVQAIKVLNHSATFGAKNVPRSIESDIPFLDSDFGEQIKGIKSYLIETELELRYANFLGMYLFFVSYSSAVYVAMSTNNNADIDTIRSLFYKLFPTFLVLFTLPATVPFVRKILRKYKKFGGLKKEMVKQHIEKFLSYEQTTSFSIEAQEIACKILAYTEPEKNLIVKHGSPKLTEAIRLAFEKYLAAQAKKWRCENADFTLSVPLWDRHGEMTAVVQGDTRKLINDSGIEFDVPTYSSRPKLRVEQNPDEKHKKRLEVNQESNPQEYDEDEDEIGAASMKRFGLSS